LALGFYTQAPGKIPIFTERSPAAAWGRPAARDDRTPVNKRLGWGLDSPSVDWRGWLGGKRLRRRSATREAADGRSGRNAGELAGRPANACAWEGPRGSGGCYGGAWARAEAVGCTGELGAAAMADAEERCGAAPEQCEGGGGAWGVGSN
jgi:hypothetical protein